MKLSTMISEAAWLNMLKKGYLVCDDTKYSSMPECLDCYEWMMEQMKQRIGPPPLDAKQPLWAWQKYFSVRRKAPTTSWGNDEKSNRIYRIIFEADKAGVLLSDYGDWHCVLNYLYLGVSEGDYAAFDAEFDDRELTPEETAKKHAVIRKSWERIFDLDLVKVFGGSIEKCERIQACLWKIELSQVTKVQPYISTGYKWKTIQPRLRCLHDKIQPPFDQYSLGSITTQKPSVQFA